MMIRRHYSKHCNVKKLIGENNMKIKPHKGGRTIFCGLNLTPEEKELIWQIKYPLSLADYLVKKARLDAKRQNKKAKIKNAED